MDTYENFAKVLRDFGESIHLGTLELDANDACELCLDNTQNVQISFNRDRSELEFLTEIGELNENYLEKSCDCFLKANCEWDLTHGMTLSKCPNSSKILLGYNVPALNVDLSIFEKSFKAFIEAFELWKDFLKQLYYGEMPDVLAEL